MPFKSRSKKRSAEKKRGRARPVSSAASSQVEVPAARRVAPSEVVKPSVTPPAPSYVYVGRELKRIAIITGLVLAILAILTVFLR